MAMDCGFLIDAYQKALLANQTETEGCLAYQIVISPASIRKPFKGNAKFRNHCLSIFSNTGNSRQTLNEF